MTKVNVNSIPFKRILELAVVAGHKNDMPFGGDNNITMDMQLKYVKFALAIIEELSNCSNNIDHIMLERIAEIAKTEADYKELDWMKMTGEAMTNAMLRNSAQELFYTRFAHRIAHEVKQIVEDKPTLRSQEYPHHMQNVIAGNVAAGATINQVHIG